MQAAKVKRDSTAHQLSVGEEEYGLELPAREGSHSRA
jgi:hypothetical protein